MPLLPSGKARFNWNIDPELRRKFDEICAVNGYQKQIHVERMLKDWIMQEESKAQRSAKARPAPAPEATSLRPPKPGRGFREGTND